MSNYELNRHKAKDKIKWVFTGISFLLVFVMLAGMCLQLFGTGKVKPSEWFKKPDTEQTQPDKIGGNETTDGMVVSPAVTTAKGMRLTSKAIPANSVSDSGISGQSSDSYTLSVNLEPLGATDYLDWSISNNEDNAITLSVASDLLSATITCNKAFDVQKVITVTSTTNPTLTASCTLDYYKRLESVSVKGLTTINFPLRQQLIRSNLNRIMVSVLYLILKSFWIAVVFNVSLRYVTILLFCIAEWKQMLKNRFQ